MKKKRKARYSKGVVHKGGNASRPGKAKQNNFVMKTSYLNIWFIHFIILAWLILTPLSDSIAMDQYLFHVTLCFVFELVFYGFYFLFIKKSISLSQASISFDRVVSDAVVFTFREIRSIKKLSRKEVFFLLRKGIGVIDFYQIKAKENRIHYFTGVGFKVADLVELEQRLHVRDTNSLL